VRFPGLRALSYLATLALIACGGGDADPGTHDSGPVGPVTLEVFPGDFVSEDTPLVMLSEGDPVKLVAAPQGGHVIHVGAQVRGLSSDIVNLRGRIRDPATDAIVTEEARDVVMKPVPGAPDLMQPDLRSVSQVTHIPACPDYEDFDLVDQPFTLEVVITEIEGPGVGSARLGVRPSCEQSDATEKAQCQCECQASYVLGKCSGVQ